MMVLVAAAAAVVAMCVRIDCCCDANGDDNVANADKDSVAKDSGRCCTR